MHQNPVRFPWGTSPTHLLWKLGNLTTQNLACRQHLNLIIFDEHCHRSFLDAIASLAPTRPVVCSRKISAVTPCKFSYHGHHQHYCVKNFAQELRCVFFADFFFLGLSEAILYNLEAFLTNSGAFFLLENHQTIDQKVSPRALIFQTLFLHRF